MATKWEKCTRSAEECTIVKSYKIFYMFSLINSSKKEPRRGTASELLRVFLLFQRSGPFVLTRPRRPLPPHAICPESFAVSMWRVLRTNVTNRLLTSSCPCVTDTWYQGPGLCALNAGDLGDPQFASSTPLKHSVHVKPRHFIYWRFVFGADSCCPQARGSLWLSSIVFYIVKGPEH